jgi:hypothetical protein
MSVRFSEIESGTTEAQQIAEQTTAREYFLSQQEKLIDDWADKASRLFQYSIHHKGSRGKCSRASTNGNLRNWLISTPTSMRIFTTKAERSLKPIAFLIER